MEIDKRAYSGAVYDIIKFDLGYDKNFVLPNDIKALLPPVWVGANNFIFGRAFTARGDKTPTPNHRIVAEMIDDFTAGDIYILQANDNSRAHFGDIMATFLKQVGAKGAVLQGWTRDINRIRALGFPIWAKGVQPQDSADRWGITNYLGDIVIGNIFITSNDYIFADEDGVLVIRPELLSEVVGILPSKLDYEESIRLEIKAEKPARLIYDEKGRW